MFKYISYYCGIVMAEDKQGDGEAKFNMGLATLQAIRNLLDIYNRVSIENSIVAGGKVHMVDTYDAQVIKSRTCNQLLISSRVLLKPEQKTLMEGLIAGTELKYVEYRDPRTKMITGKRAIYSPIVNTNCDKFVSTLSDKLQENNVFMPKKGESSLF
jgi:hypothetical protein